MGVDISSLPAGPRTGCGIMRAWRLTAAESIVHSAVSAGSADFQPWRGHGSPKGTLSRAKLWGNLVIACR